MAGTRVPLSPFLTERARIRAPQILAYAAASGGAALVAPSGAVVLASATGADADLARVARVARRLGGARAAVSFRAGELCVHAAPVVHGYLVCVVALPSISWTVTADRLHKAAHVLALAMLDGMPPSGGAPPAPAPSVAGGAPSRPARRRPS